MTRHIHPSELTQLIQNRLIARSVALGLLIIGLGLLAGGSRSKSPEARLWLFGGGFGCALLCRVVHKIAIDNERLFEDSRDISLTNWQNQLFKRTRDEGLTLEAQVQQPEPERVPLFDWSELADSDQHPVLAVIAPMGGGKSRLVKWLGKSVLFDRQPSIVAFDIYSRQGDWEQGITEYADMLGVMKDDLAEISDRKQRYRVGESDFAPQFRVLEEAVDTLPNITALSKEAEETVDSWLRVHVSVARKLRFRLCLVSVKLRGSDIGIGSESRDDATVIFAGQKGVQKAMTDTRYFKLGAKQNRELKEQLQASLTGIKHPALIYSGGEWFPASIPNLSGTGDPIGVIPIISKTPVKPLNISDEISGSSRKLTEIQEGILDLSNKKGWIKAKDCQRSGWREFSGKSADGIRADFLTLIDLGLGVGRYEGERLQFCSNEWNSEDSDSPD
jgi:hypothetical protein